MDTSLMSHRLSFLMLTAFTVCLYGTPEVIADDKAVISVPESIPADLSRDVTTELNRFSRDYQMVQAFDFRPKQNTGLREPLSWPTRPTSRLTATVFSFGLLIEAKTTARRRTTPAGNELAIEPISASKAGVIFRFAMSKCMVPIPMLGRRAPMTPIERPSTASIWLV